MGSMLTFMLTIPHKGQCYGAQRPKQSLVI